MSASVTAFTSTSHTAGGGAAMSMSKYTQRRQRVSGSAREPITVKRFFTSQPLGTTTVSRLRVSMAVWRQRISTTRPLTSSTLTQSPTRIDWSSCSTTPPRTLPSVSCIEKAITAVITAEVVTRLARSTPSMRSHTSAPRERDARR